MRLSKDKNGFSIHKRPVSRHQLAYHCMGELYDGIFPINGHWTRVWSSGAKVSGCRGSTFSRVVRGILPSGQFLPLSKMAKTLKWSILEMCLPLRKYLTSHPLQHHEMCEKFYQITFLNCGPRDFSVLLMANLYLIFVSLPQSGRKISTTSKMSGKMPKLCQSS